MKMISLHIFVGVLLIAPVLLKMGSTTWRFWRYYAGAKSYRRSGPPPLVLRAHEELGHGRVGPFDLEFVAVNHSIPDALAVAIKTPAGTVLHTGDFKMDQLPLDGRLTDLRAFARLGEEGIDLFLTDSTNAEVPGFVVLASPRLTAAQMQHLQGLLLPVSINGIGTSQMGFVWFFGRAGVPAQGVSSQPGFSVAQLYSISPPRLCASSLALDSSLYSRTTCS